MSEEIQKEYEAAINNSNSETAKLVDLQRILRLNGLQKDAISVDKSLDSLAEIIKTKLDVLKEIAPSNPELADILSNLAVNDYDGNFKTALSDLKAALTISETTASQAQDTDPLVVAQSNYAAEGETPNPDQVAAANPPEITPTAPTADASTGEDKGQTVVVETRPDRREPVANSPEIEADVVSPITVPATDGAAEVAANPPEDTPAATTADASTGENQGQTVVVETRPDLREAVANSLEIKTDGVSPITVPMPDGAAGIAANPPEITPATPTADATTGENEGEPVVVETRPDRREPVANSPEIKTDGVSPITVPMPDGAAGIAANPPEITPATPTADATTGENEGEQADGSAGGEDDQEQTPALDGEQVTAKNQPATQPTADATAGSTDTATGNSGTTGSNKTDAAVVANTPPVPPENSLPPAPTGENNDKAASAPEGTTATATPASDPIQAELDAVLARNPEREPAARLQAELKRSDLLNGRIDGLAGKQTKEAIEKVSQKEIDSNPNLKTALEAYKSAQEAEKLAADAAAAALTQTAPVAPPVAATPEQAPTPAPDAAAEPSPAPVAPSAAATAEPVPTPTPTVTAEPSPAPIAPPTTATPEPAPTPTPAPTAKAEPSPAPTAKPPVTTPEPTVTPTPAPTAKAVNPAHAAIDAELAATVKANPGREHAAIIQAELKKAELLKGEIDGRFGPATRAALKNITPEIAAKHPQLSESLSKLDLNKYNEANRKAIEAARAATSAPTPADKAPEAAAPAPSTPAPENKANSYVVGKSVGGAHETVYEIAKSWMEANPDKVGKDKEFRNHDAVRQWIVKENNIKQTTSVCDGKKVQVDIIREGMELTLPPGNPIGEVDKDKCVTCEAPPKKPEPVRGAAEPKPDAKPEKPKRAPKREPKREEPAGICPVEKIEERLLSKFPNLKLDSATGVHGDPNEGRVTVLNSNLDDATKRKIIEAAGSCKGRVGFTPPPGDGGHTPGNPISGGKPGCDNCGGGPGGPGR